MWDKTKIRSNLEFRSLGFVAKNKSRDTNEIEVYPFEILPNLKTALTSKTVESVKEGISFKTGKPYRSTVKRGMSIKAEWLGKTNMGLAPDVRWREQVKLYQAGDSDKWYWTSLGRDDDLRRLESLLFYINANPEATDMPLDKDHLYRLYISSHDKIITLTTTTANGEFTTYEFTFNLKDGKVELRDGEGNYLLLNSAETLIKLFNKDETTIELNRTNILAKSKDKINLETTDYTLDAETVTVNCKTYTENSDTSTINTKVHAVNATSSSTITAPMITLAGTVVQAGGPVTLGGGVTASGAMDVKGPSTLTTAVMTGLTLSGPLVAQGATFSLPISAPKYN